MKYEKEIAGWLHLRRSRSEGWWYHLRWSYDEEKMKVR